jgi:hypothetical protein
VIPLVAPFHSAPLVVAGRGLSGAVMVMLNWAERALAMGGRRLGVRGGRR